MKKLLMIAVSVMLAASMTSCGSNAELEQLRKENDELRSQLVTPEPTKAVTTPTPPPTPSPEETLAPEDISNILNDTRGKIVKENYGYVPYDNLARNPNEYKEKSLSYEGKILQIMEDSDTLAKSHMTYLEIRLAVGGNYNNVVYVTYLMGSNDSRFLEDDYVKIYGTSKGLYTYKSTMGKSITIPSIYADLIEKK